MRYFTKFSNDGSAKCLYRFEVQENRIVEDEWKNNGWQQDSDARVVGYLSIGEPDYDEINEDIAQKLFPEAFELSSNLQPKSPSNNSVSDRKYVQVPKNFYISSEKDQSKFVSDVIASVRPDATGSTRRRPIRYRVNVQGSSITGTLDGIDDYKRAFAFLQEKSSLGKISCFKWWCEQCKVVPLVKSASPEKHVIKISIPNVIKIIAESQIDWKWKNPNSDWAIKIGDANNHYADLVRRKSRPNWVIRIAAEETGIDYVFKG